MRKICLLLLIVALAFPNAEWATAEQTPRVVILSLDGNAYWFMQELLHRGKVRTLQKLVSTYEFSSPQPLIPNFCSKTAPGHASLFTGTYANIHGVTANSVFKLPLPKHDLLQWSNGFDGNVLLVEPIWILAAKNNIKTVVHQATHAFPPPLMSGKEKTQVDQNLTLVDGYNQAIGWDAVFTFDDLKPINQNIYALTLQESKFYLSQEREDAIAWSSTPEFKDKELLSRGVEHRHALSVETTDGARQGYLAWIGGSLNGRNIKLYQSQLSRRRSNVPVLQGSDDLPPFIPNAAGHPYMKGAFGTPLCKGGSGEAEALYLETALALIENAEAFSVRLQQKVGRGELEIYYLPFPDEALHQWAGYLLKDSPLFKPALAEKYWEYVETLMERVTVFIDRVIFNQGRTIPETFFLVADHGMDYAIRDFEINEALARAGFLTWKDEKIDLSQSSIIYPPVNGMFLKVNLKSYRHGVVLEKNKNVLLQKVTRYLLTLRDPMTDHSIVRNVWPARLWEELGSGGPRGGDLYLELEPGYYIDGHKASGEIVTTRDLTSSGVHGFWPLRPTMWATFMVASRTARFQLQEHVLQTQIVPSVTQLLGIPTPAYARAPALKRKNGGMGASE